MAKLKLNIESLEVESFPTEAEGEPARGTVRAREDTVAPCMTAGGYTCVDSCYWSEVQCQTQDCGTDFDTCFDFGSCCPARCHSGETW